jgi:hypothetical protein
MIDDSKVWPNFHQEESDIICKEWKRKGAYIRELTAGILQ